MLVRINLNTKEIKVTYPGNNELWVGIQYCNHFYFHEFKGFPSMISNDNDIMQISEKCIEKEFFEIKEKAKCQ